MNVDDILGDDDGGKKPVSYDEYPGRQINSKFAQFLVQKFPEYRSTEDEYMICAYQFTEAMEISHETFYRWVRGKPISRKMALRMIELSNGRIERVEMLDFVL